MSKCYCDWDAPTFYHKTTPKARKEHQCSECFRVIHSGERYERVRGMWNGDIGIFRTCARCLDLREWVTAHIPCSCWMHGNMREDILADADHYGMQAPGLWFGALRREVLIRRNSNKRPSGAQP